jgi:hypothetical protein
MSLSQSEHAVGQRRCSDSGPAEARRHRCQAETTIETVAEFREVARQLRFVGLVVGTMHRRLDVCTRPAGDQIGFFTVTGNPAHRTAEAGVVIGDRDWCGKNLVLEARPALLDSLFDRMDMHLAHMRLILYLKARIGRQLEREAIVGIAGIDNVVPLPEDDS